MALFGLFKKKNKDVSSTVEIQKNETSQHTKEVAEAKEVVTPAPAKKTVESKSTDTTKTVSTEKTVVKKATAPKSESKAPAKKETAPEKAPVAEVSAPVEEPQPVVEATTENNEVEDVVATTATVAKGYTGKFEINKSKDGKKFFFNLYASNKVGIATSQMYSSAQSALNGVNSVIANAEKAPVEDQSLKSYETLPYPKWELYVDNGGKYRFRLCASNGSCVCHSQGYTTKAACKNGIDSIIRSSKNAEIDKTYIAKKD